MMAGLEEAKVPTRSRAKSNSFGKEKRFIGISPKDPTETRPEDGAID